MFTIIFVTPWSFTQKRGGDYNRALGLAGAISKMANVIVLHQGPHMRIDGARFFHYEPLFSRNEKCNSLVMNVMNYYSSSMAASITALVENIASTEEVHIIQVEQTFPFLPALRARNSINKDVILSLDNHKVYSPLPKLKLTSDFLYSVYRVMNIPYVKSMESFAVNRSDIVLCVSNNEARILRELHNLKNDRVYVVPNGVSVNRFEDVSLPEEYKGFGNAVIFFHGTLSWYPNMEAANIIMDYIAPAMENSTFVICGSNPYLTFLRKISRSKNVRFLGYVENLPRYIKGADLCIAPLISGGGTKLKLLEYAAAGKPIIATKKAAEGLPFVNEHNALLFDDVDDEFVNGIRRVLSDEELGARLGHNAKELAQEYDWNKIAEGLFELYEGILEKDSAHVHPFGGE